MPWGWVDNSLSITSVGSSSFGFPGVPRRARRISENDSQNRIHRAAILCTVAFGDALRGFENQCLGGGLQCASAIDHQHLARHEFRMHEEQYRLSDINGPPGPAKRCALDVVGFQF